MVPEWWGHTRLHLGWAYLFACIAYQVARGRMLASGSSGGRLRRTTAAFSRAYDLNEVISMHITHTSIVLCGVVCALLFFYVKKEQTSTQRFIHAAAFAFFLALVATLLHCFYIISKIGATPPWALYCGAIATAVFMFLYWLINIRQVARSGWRWLNRQHPIP